MEEQLRMEDEMFAEEMAALGETDPQVIAELQAERQATKLKEIVAKNKKSIETKKKASASGSLSFAPTRRLIFIILATRRPR